jgi:hypothetical protein
MEFVDMAMNQMTTATRLSADLDLISRAVAMVLEVVDEDMLYSRPRLKLAFATIIVEHLRTACGMITSLLNSDSIEKGIS